VVIDPGHGGKDPGAIGIGGIQEKQIIFPIAQQIAQILEKQGIQVRMTRSSDYFVSLQGRTQMANQMGADVFVSIHANSMGLSRPDVNGLETYYFGKGKGLADVIHRNILQRLNVRDRRVRSARFYVLRKANMPSVLVETGYVTGGEDSRKLSDPSYRSQMAQAIAFGILEYIKRNKL
jgi:N-acetylmuramoyl-L-alanine amidase